MYILGISAFYHDSAASLVKNGEIIAAAQEERFSRKKNDAAFPEKAITFCLEQAGISLSEIQHVVFYENPNLKLKRIVRNHIANVFKSFSLYLDTFPGWLFSRYRIKHIIKKQLGSQFTGEIHYGHHHRSHLASSYYPSPFDDALLVSIDGVGESDSTVIAKASRNSIKILQRQIFPHSVGLLYSAFTSYCGFKINSGEYKLMGLAPYGKPIYKDMIEQQMLKLTEQGELHLNLSYFPFCHEHSMFNEKKWQSLFNIPARQAESRLTQDYANLASSIQAVTKNIVYKIIKHAQNLYPATNLCLSGGVALNCVINGQVIKDFNFEHVWIQPAAGDAGGSLGAALALYYELNHNKELKRKINEDTMKGSYLGPEFSNDDIESSIIANHLSYKKLNNEELINKAAQLLLDGQIVGWFQGRMEFGPRALGNRSILGDPKNSRLQKEMNLKIKYRESFRPFAPSVLENQASKFFEFNHTSRYMQFVAKVKKEYLIKDPKTATIDPLYIEPRSLIPAVTHVDDTARLQTVNSSSNPKYARLIEKFGELSGYPMLINTSFNIRGEPIVCKPQDAIKCFLYTEMDVLIIGNFIVQKNDNQINNLRNEQYLNQYELD